MTPTPKFHRLTIAEVRRETSDAISVAFAIPPDLAPLYAYRAGQYLTLRLTLDGAELRRSYSICAGEDEGQPRIAIKRMADGVFSAWAQEHLRAGDTIDVMTPTGRFGLVENRAGLHVGIAAGSGITPLLSILTTTLAREPESRFFLFYGSRSTQEILFRAQLEDLKDRYLGRLSVFHVLSKEQQDIDILNGRLDGDKLPRLLRGLLGAAEIAQAYICGPEGLIDTATAALHAAGLAEERLHVERFTSVHSGRPRPKPVTASGAPPAAIAHLVLDGAHHDVPVREGEAILDAALRAGLDLPYACKGGMCSTCRARLIEGEAPMAVNYALEPWELKNGFILTCQAHPATPRVTVDYDQQ